MTAGRFREVRSGNLEFYVVELSDDGRRMKNVFVETEILGVRNVLSAETGLYQVFGGTGDRYLVLVNGQRYVGQPGDALFKIIRFKEHGLLVEEHAVAPSTRKVIAYHPPALLAQPGRNETAELQRRFV